MSPQRPPGPQESTFAFDVALSSHELLRRGIVEHRLVRTVVSARDRTEAALIAAQMASCHGMCTKIYDRI